MPSWLGSLVVHVLVLLLFAWTLPPPRLATQNQDEDRDIGLLTREGFGVIPEDQETIATVGEPPGASAANEAPTPDTGSPPQTPASTPSDLPLPEVPSAALAALPLPPPLMGAGPITPVNPSEGVPAGSVQKTISGAARAGNSPRAGLSAPGSVSLFGRTVAGQRFVYVFDCSASMNDYNAIGVAKSELLSSLEQLDPTQQFQIIFYNDRPFPMPRQGTSRDVFFGTDVNRTLARQFIDSIQPDGSTRHLDALLLALTYNPDVIFFLTDAGEPVLGPRDLETIKRRNRSHAQIHTVEFGKGPQLTRVDNFLFLKRLARENDGTHTYRDVTRFVRGGL